VSPIEPPARRGFAPARYEPAMAPRFGPPRRSHAAAWLAFLAAGALLGLLASTSGRKPGANSALPDLGATRFGAPLTTHDAPFAVVARDGNDAPLGPDAGTRPAGGPVVSATPPTPDAPPPDAALSDM